MLSPKAALAAGVVAVAAVAVPVLSASGDPVQTVSFKEINKGATFNYVDMAPMNNPRKRPVLSPGDEFVFTSPIVDDKGRDGELRAKCTAAKRAPANDTGFGKSHPLCIGAFVLRDGTIFVQTVDTGNTTRGAVSGGTGAYANARGTFQSTTTKTGNDDTVTLVP